MSRTSTPTPGDSSNRPFAQRRADGPRKVRHGIKLTGILQSDKSDQDQSISSAGLQIARDLLRLIESKAAPAHWDAGLEYGKSGQVVSFGIQPGRIAGQVQGALPRPYSTSWTIPKFSESQWEEVIEAMAAEAVHVAKLLAGEMPPINELLDALGLLLLPKSQDNLECQCTCEFATQPVDGEGDRACKHAVALAAVAAEQLAREPLNMFELLGMPVEQLLDRLKRAREIQSHGVAGTHSEPAISESLQLVPPLEAMIENFWRSPSRVDSDDPEADLRRVHHIPHALLRRLGPSPMNGRFPLVGLLASVYDTVSAAAKNLRDEDEK